MGMQCRVARSGSGGCGSVHDFQGIEGPLWQAAAGCVGALPSGSFQYRGLCGRWVGAEVAGGSDYGVLGNLPEQGEGFGDDWVCELSQ